MQKSFIKSAFLHISVILIYFLLDYIAPKIQKHVDKSIPVEITFGDQGSKKEGSKKEKSHPKKEPIKKAIEKPKKDESKKSVEKPIEKPIEKIERTEKKEAPQKAKPITPEKPVEAQPKSQAAIPTKMTPSQAQAQITPQMQRVQPNPAQAPMRPSMASAPMQKSNETLAEAAPLIKEPSRVRTNLPMKPSAAFTQAVSPMNPAKAQPNYTQSPVRPSMSSAPMQKPNQPQAEAAPATRDVAKAPTHTVIKPAEVLTHTMAPSVPSKTQLTSMQTPKRPTIASAPMQKQNQPQAETAPTTRDVAKAPTHTVVKPTETLAQTTASPAVPSKTQLSSMQTPMRPAIASAPMQKPNQPQAEAAPTVKQSVTKIATIVKAVMATPVNQPMAVAAPSAPKLTPIVQPKANSAPTAVGATGDELDGIKRGYLQGIEQEIKKHKTYPKAAKENNNEMGIVKVKFRVGANGEILKIAVVESSGSKILDKAAIDLLTKIAKFKALPSMLKRQHMDITLNIDYTLH